MQRLCLPVFHVPPLPRHPNYIGIFLGAAYGFGTRIIFGGANAIDSMTFIMVCPRAGHDYNPVRPRAAPDHHNIIWAAPCFTITVCFIGMFITELEVSRSTSR